MFIDIDDLEDNSVIETDLCIVGGGAAGISLANEFLDSQLRVCILESGALHYSSATQALYHGNNIGLPYFSLMSCRLRFFGGTTNHWEGYCRRYRPLDFEKRGWIPNSGWPITYEELVPFYERAEMLLDLPTELWDIEKLQTALDKPFLPFDIDKFRTKSAVIKPVRMGALFETKFEGNDNVTVYLNANVTSLESNADSSRVTHAKIGSLVGKRHIVRAKRFVVAAGGLENPRILLLSDSVMPSGLGNQRDLVGRYFMDHARFKVGEIVPASSGIDMSLYSNHRLSGASTSVTLSVSDQVQRSVGVSANGFQVRGIRDRRSTTARLLRYWKKALAKIGTDVKQDAAVSANDISDLLEYSPPEDMTVENYLTSAIPLKYISCTMRIDPIPNPSSRVMLSNELDALGQKRIDLDWQLTDMDLDYARKTVDVLSAEVGRSGIGRMKSLIHSKADWHGMLDEDTALRANWHHMGTTRMGDSEENGVVDKNCKVFGLNNLYIAGSSVFNTSGSGTPTLTIVALAIRLADHLKRSS